MNNLDDFTKITLGPVVKLKKIDTMGLRINGLNDNISRYIIRDHNSDELNFAIYTYDKNVQKEEVWKDKLLHRTLTGIAGTGNMVNIVKSLIDYLSTLTIDYYFHDVKDGTVNFIDTSRRDEWVANSVDTKEVVAFCLVALRNTLVLQHNEYELHDILLNLARKTSCINYITDLLNTKFVAVGTTIGNIYVSFENISVLKLTNPDIIVVTRELNPLLGEIEISTEMRKSHYFIHRDLKQLISCELSLSNIWVEVDRDAYEKFNGNKFNVSISDNEAAMIYDMDHYLDSMVFGGTDFMKLPGLLNETMPINATSHTYAKKKIYPSNYLFDRTDVTAVLLDSLHEGMKRNVLIDNLLEVEGYRIDAIINNIDERIFTVSRIPKKN